MTDKRHPHRLKDFKNSITNVITHILSQVNVSLTLLMLKNEALDKNQSVLENSWITNDDKMLREDEKVLIESEFLEQRQCPQRQLHQQIQVQKLEKKCSPSFPSVEEEGGSTQNQLKRKFESLLTKFSQKRRSIFPFREIGDSHQGLKRLWSSSIQARHLEDEQSASFQQFDFEDH